MLGSSPIVAFLATTDISRAVAFFRDLLGLRLVEETPYAAVFDAGGTTLRVTPVDSFVPHRFTVAGWVVGDIVAAAGALAAAGTSTIRYDGMDQDDLGIWTTPGGDRVAWFADPDGNVLSVTEFRA
jgi:catechol 2,3-dioxygenase-like lactoylglutathione lyase family enzyme